MESVGVDSSNTRRPDIRAKIRANVHRHFSGPSDRTKWERIGRPLFVEQPVALFALLNPYSTPKMRLAAASDLLDLWLN